LGSVLAELAKTQPQEAIKQSLSLPLQERKAALGAVLSQWAENDPDAAIAYWNSHPDLTAETSTFSRALTKLAKTDPAKAASFALGLRAAQSVLDNNYELERTLAQWASKDLSSARQWALGLKHPQQSQSALESLARALVKTQPAAAFEIANSMQSATDREGLASNLLNSWARVDPAAAMDYVAKLEPAQAERLGRLLGYNLADLPLPEAKALLQRLPEGKSKQAILNDLIRNHSRKGRYTDVVQMLNDMPDSVERDRALHQLALDWTKKDTAAVAAWLKSLPDNSDRDLLIAGYSSRLAATDPRAAATAIATVPDESVRRTAYQNILMTWRVQDAAAANAWFNSLSDLSASQRKSILLTADSMGRFASSSSAFLTTPTIKQRRN
jgi:hypothetical protein